jgi:error-prone DNA polymerase
MLVVDGKVQREGDVVHIVATKLHDASALLASVGDRGEAFPRPPARGDEFHRGGSPDARDAPPRAIKVRDIYIPDLHLDTIKPKVRDFR